ncbi:MAG: hypothetical protein E7368_02790 [Clostridiales bacterium]|nr:hypothetical protein [Clostridiales bacterium]
MENKDNENVQDVQTEAIATANTGAEGDCPNSASTVGKFKDVDALKKAYDCLQAEFTRRSQRLKILEREAENFKAGQREAGAVEKLRKNAEKIKAENKEFDGFIADLEGANVCALEETDAEKPDLLGTVYGEKNTSASVCEQNTVENKGGDVRLIAEEPSVASSRKEPTSSSDELYRLASENEEVRLKIIGEYLHSVGKSGAPLIRGGNGVLPTPPKKAKSLREAGEMALRWLKNGNAEA